MENFIKNLLLAIFVAVTIIISYWIGQQAYNWMPPQATSEARQVDHLFSFLVTVGAWIFLSIVGVIIYSLIFHRVPRGDYSEGHPARSNWKIETLWLVIPTILVVWIACQSYNIYQTLNFQGLTPPLVIRFPGEESANATDIPQHQEKEKVLLEPNQNLANIFIPEIGVSAKQWNWVFYYPNKVISNQELHLQVNQPVRLVLQSEDVLHGFYVPEFRVKQDIIPHRHIVFQFTPSRVGKYRLHDSQFSGTDFALMEADVYVDTLRDYQQWLAEMKNSTASLETLNTTSINSFHRDSNLIAFEHDKQGILIND
ncbi:MAG TPA: cytochrome c oxidase subunit II [Nostocaceae cyanobacterium]|nr:cytochrome c oxidase subunit II [Nostocaceae cyanobacterium]